MTSTDITFCNNPRCNLTDTCKRARPAWPKSSEYVSMACFGPSNGDEVEIPSDCEYYLE
jgi:hypothetical protein